MSNENHSGRIRSNKIQFGENYVLPIEQSRVTVSQAKVKKMMEETDERAQQIISGAETKSNVIVQTANTEASRIIEEAKKKAQDEYETIKQQAYQEGFEKGEADGLAKFQQDAQEGLKSLETLASSNFNIKKNIIDSATHDIVDLVNLIADKVCHQQFNSKVLHNITLDAIKQLNDKENITIIVSPLLVDKINQIVPDIRDQIANLQSLKILEDNSISPDGVIVETPELRVDSRISSQISEIAEKMLTGGNDGVE